MMTSRCNENESIRKTNDILRQMCGVFNVYHRPDNFSAFHIIANTFEGFTILCNSSYFIFVFLSVQGTIFVMFPDALSITRRQNHKNYVWQKHEQFYVVCMGF